MDNTWEKKLVELRSEQNESRYFLWLSENILFSACQSDVVSDWYLARFLKAILSSFNQHTRNGGRGRNLLSYHQGVPYQEHLFFNTYRFCVECILIIKHFKINQNVFRPQTSKTIECLPLTPFGISRKSSTPWAFWVEFQAQWSVPTRCIVIKGIIWSKCQIQKVNFNRFLTLERKKLCYT